MKSKSGKASAPLGCLIILIPLSPYTLTILRINYSDYYTACCIPYS
nr:MAG TPA: hypothetical protein [Caudoviricetes sp.]